MIKKIVMMCAAALFACAGALAADDGGSDPVVLSPGEWTTGLTVNGKRVWSKYSAPKGGGWNCTYDSKAKCFKLNLIAPLREYTIGGELTGRVMDNSGKVTDVKAGMVDIGQTCTVTLDNFSVTGKKDDAAVSIKGGKTVKLVIRGTSTIAETEGSSSIALCMPPKTSVTVSGGKADSLVVAGRVTGAKRAAGGEIALDGPQLSLAADSDLSKLVIVRGGVQARAADAILKLRVENELLVPKGTSLSAGKIVTRKASVDGRLDIIRMSATAAEISANAEVTVGEYLRAMNLQILGGKVSLPNDTSEIVIVDGAKMEACGGSIIGKGSIHTLNLNGDLGWIYRKGPGEPLIADRLNEDWDSDVLFYWPELEKLNDPVLNVRGGLIDVYEIGRDHNRSRHGNADSRHNMDVYVYVGEVRVVHSEVQQFRQNGGRFFAVNDGNGNPALDCYYSLDICGQGMFYASDVVFEKKSTLYPCPQIAGGNVNWPWKTGLVRFPYSQTGCSCVEVSGLPAASEVHVGDLPFEYDLHGNCDKIWTDDDGRLFLWFPNREEPYQFSVEGKVYEAKVSGMATTAKQLGPRRYMVVYETVFGTLWDAETGRRAKEATFYLPCGEPIPVFSPDDLKLTYSGRNFKGWTISEENGRKIYPTKDVMPGDTIGPIYCDIRLVDYSREITAADVNKNPDEGAAPVDPAKTGEKIVTVRFYLDPWEGNPRDYVERDYIAGSRYGNLPVVTPPAGRVLDFWQRRTGGGFGGEKITEDSIVRAENHCLYANWKLPPTTEWTCQFVTKTGLSDDSDWSVFATHDFNIASPVAWMPSETPTRPRHRFVRWETYNDRECIMEPVTIGTIAAQRPDRVEAVWERDWFDWTRNRFESKVLSTVTDGFPSDPAQVKSVKGQGLATGLKLVQDKTTKQWCLEGVPTELVDHATRDMYVEVTLKDGTKSTLLVKVRVNPEVPVVMRPAFVNENYGMCEYLHRLDENGRKLGSVAQLTPSEMRHPYVMADEFWPGADKSWKITGLPTGLKLATKDATAWTDAAGVKQSAPLGSIYGFVKSPCAATVTASHTVKGVAGGSYTETYKSLIEIHEYKTTVDGYWVGGFLVDARIEGYVGEKLVYTFPSDHGLANNSKFKFTGLPSGLSFTAVEKKVSGYETPIPAGSIYGSVTKETLAYAKGTDGSDARPIDVLVSITERPPEVSVDAGAGGLYKISLMKFKPTEAAAISDAGTSLMKGAAYKYRINCDANAKVKVSGQPAGLKLVQNKDKKSADYGKWTLEGAPSKVGEYVAVITVTLNGVSTSITQRYVVQENAYAGDYRGVIASSPAADAAPRAGTIIVNIAEGGATKVTVCEDGKSTMTYSAKSFGYVDSGDYAYVEFELKPSSADAKLGYGVRKGRVTITKPDVEADDYRILEGVVKLEDGTAVGEVEGNFVAPSAANALGSGIDRESRFFTVSDGGFDVPIATVRHEIKSGQKIPTADIAVTLYDGTTAKIAKQPIVRDAAKPGTDEAQRACYSLAPFAVKAKDGQVFVFHGFKYRGYNLVDALEGVVTFVSADGELVTVDETDADEHSIAAMELNDYFKHMYKAKTTLMTLDYGWNGFETFALDHVNGGTKRDCLVLDLDGAEIAKIPAKNKVGMDGAFSYKFTTKDKVTYQLDLVVAQEVVYYADGTHFVMEFCRLVGMVTKTWKEGKETKTLHGVVDFMTLDPEE